MVNKILKINKKFKNILVISDLHIPNHHPDAFQFLSKIKRMVEPDLVVQIGDLVEMNTVSRYTLNPDYVSPATEFIQAYQYTQEFLKIFPKMIWVLGNHDIRVLAKAERDGIPSCFFKDFHTLLDLPQEWKICESLVLNNETLFTHGKSSVPNKVAEYSGKNVVQGHFHHSFAVTWVKTLEKDLFSLYTGCLIDDTAVVFNYNKGDLRRPILGSGLISNGSPKLLKMNLTNNGRWDKNVAI